MNANIDWTPPKEPRRPIPEAGGNYTQSHARRMEKRVRLHEWRKTKLTELANNLQRTNDKVSINTALKILRITASVPPEETDE